MILYRNFKIIIVIAAISVFACGCATQGAYFRLDPSLTKDMRTFNNAQYINLNKLCDFYGLNCRWDEYTRTALVEKKGKVITLRAGSNVILADGVERRLDRSVILDGGVAHVPASFAYNNLGYLVGEKAARSMPGREASKEFTIRTIVLDPGHGGKDPGAIGKKLRLREKDLTLAIAKRVKGILEENGIRVIMTRNDDIFIPLSKRAGIANDSNADLFVSVHVNASRSRRLRGFECYYLSNATDDNARAVEATENESLEFDEGSLLDNSKGLSATLWDMTLSENRQESTELAKAICDSVKESLAFDSKGIKSARFYVLKHTRIPAVLVEDGYISNRYEEAKLADPKFLDRLADALANGILQYKKEYERTEGFTNT